jgi:hypothetical protein
MSASGPEVKFFQPLRNRSRPRKAIKKIRVDRTPKVSALSNAKPYGKRYTTLRVNGS